MVALLQTALLTAHLAPAHKSDKTNDYLKSNFLPLCVAPPLTLIEHERDPDFSYLRLTEVIPAITILMYYVHSGKWRYDLSGDLCSTILSVLGKCESTH